MTPRRPTRSCNRSSTPGCSSPVEIVIDGQIDDPAVASGIDELVGAHRGERRLRPASLETNSAGDLALSRYRSRGTRTTPRRSTRSPGCATMPCPTAFAATSAGVYVSGETAFNVDFNAVIDRYTPIVFAFVLGLSFILLLLAFRSLVVPLKAILMNLLSVGATYGLLVLVFQQGYLNGLLRVPAGTDDRRLGAALPVLRAVRPQHGLPRLPAQPDPRALRPTGDNRAAVAVGLQSTAKIISGAALIMVAVFAGFATGRLVMFQQMGFGLAVAVLLDATIVRSILVPASMRLLGDATGTSRAGCTGCPICGSRARRSSDRLRRFQRLTSRSLHRPRRLDDDTIKKEIEMATSKRGFWLRWMPTFVGYIAGGAVAGTIIGGGQWLALRGWPGISIWWIAATCVGSMVGLTLGAGIVGYETGPMQLAIQGAVTGLAVGVAQGLVLRTRGIDGRWWALAMSPIWALGWLASWSIGVDVERQYTNFGLAGALVATALSGVILLQIHGGVQAAGTEASVAEGVTP